MPTLPSMANNLGIFSFDKRNRQERAVVLDVFPDTFTVLLNTQDGPCVGYIPSRTPIDPDNPSGTFELPYRGSEVLISRVDGSPYILGYLPPKSQIDMGEDAERRHKVVADEVGSGAPHYENKGGIRNSGLKPDGLLPGDWGVSGKFGNMLAVLDGGINLFKSHEQAQILTFLREQLVKIIASRYKLYTDFGSVEHTSEPEGSSLRIRGAAGSAANGATDTWTIRGDLGASGNLVNLRVTDDSGFELAQLKVDPVGNVYSLAKKMTSEVMGDLRSKIKGAVNATISGVASIVFKDSLSLEVGNKMTAKLGGSDTLVSGASYTHINDAADLDVGGAASAVLNEGLTLETPNGDLTIRVGEDSNSDLVVTNKHGKLELKVTESGDIRISTTSGAVVIAGTEKIVLDTGGAADTIKLGSDGAADNIVTFSGLQGFMSVIMGMLDSHTHKDPTGATTITGVPTTPTFGSTMPLLNTAKSVSTLSS